MLDTDNLATANVCETKFSDPRIDQFWDQDRIFGEILSQRLHLKESIAWDVYLVYLPNHSWDSELPPMPILWMHQLNEEPTLFLDPPRLKAFVQNVLEGMPFP